ncbi:putative lysosomal cobalamin transporter [Golovinomyces cichoracearum]|uniref:Probable lysosomal cobalamin transporter n=1 Tax=Golovinomyces cichoracearum TaxID=62708 RepID=A0A420IB22_9PEZI|nr:putative lysosomal cobalamin transporter [Golovinomyces cichoracearum]
MKIIHIVLYCLAYGVTFGFVALSAIIFTHAYQSYRDRSALVSSITIITFLSLLATILLLPVDIALVSSTNSTGLGKKEDWAKPEKVLGLVHTIKIFYYTLYSIDAAFCFLIIPFTYFFYEEYDNVEADDGQQKFGQRLLAALKYTFICGILLFAIFIIGLLIPQNRGQEGSDFDLDYLKRLLIENHGERALNFCVGLFLSLGNILYILFTGAGIAITPILLIRSTSSIDLSCLHADTAKSLEQNRERQRKFQYLSTSVSRTVPTEIERERDRLINERQILIKRQRFATKLENYKNEILVRIFAKLEFFLTPIKIFVGILLMCFSITIWVSILIVGIEKAQNLSCNQHYGYILNKIKFFQPINYIIYGASKIYPLDQLVMTILILYFFCSSVVGIVKVGIRFLWVKILDIRKGHTLPQALLIMVVMLALVILPLNYSIAMLAPQYATFGTQTFCNSSVTTVLDERPDCSLHPELVLPCSEQSPGHESLACTPSVLSSILGIVIVNFPVFGAFCLWSQFFFLAVSLVYFIFWLFQWTKLNLRELDELAEIDEEESLLADQF